MRVSIMKKMIEGTLGVGTNMHIMKTDIMSLIAVTRTKIIMIYTLDVSHLQRYIIMDSNQNPIMEKIHLKPISRILKTVPPSDSGLRRIEH